MSASHEPTDPSSAVRTFTEAQTAPCARLLGEFGHSGFTFSRLKRVGNVAIYRQTKGKQTPAFEVVIIRTREASVAFGKEFPATEYYPRNEEWGTYGFTYRTLEEAGRKLMQLTREAKAT